jgi:hypothetical protein
METNNKMDIITFLGGAKTVFLRGCIAYRQSLDDQARSAPRTNEEYER